MFRRLLHAIFRVGSKCNWTKMHGIHGIKIYFFILKRGWTSGYIHFCSVSGDVKIRSCTRIISSRNQYQDGAVPARWRNRPYCQNIHASRTRNISGRCHFKTRRHSMTCTFSWPLSVWSLPLGVPQVYKVHRTKPRNIDELENTLRRNVQLNLTTWRKKQWEPYVTDWSSASKMVENIWEMCSAGCNICKSSNIVYLNGILFPIVLNKKYKCNLNVNFLI
jgi:hypothetical protein